MDWYKTSRDAQMIDAIGRGFWDDHFVFQTRWEVRFSHFEMKAIIVPLDYPAHAVKIDMLAISACYEPDAAVDCIRRSMRDAVLDALDEVVSTISPLADFLTDSG